MTSLVPKDKSNTPKDKSNNPKHTRNNPKYKKYKIQTNNGNQQKKQHKNNQKT